MTRSVALPQPEMSLSPSAIWCEEHLAPFEKRWPTGYLIATMFLLEMALRSDQVFEATEGIAERLQPVLLEYAPLCCLVISSGEMEAETLTGVVERAIAMDPKLVLEIKRGISERRRMRMVAEGKWRSRR
jgi:hypothetical protein